MTRWTLADIPSQAGKLAVVTGATGGLGYETALVLAQKGAQVVLAGRSDAKGQDALARIAAAAPEARVSFEKLDLGSLASVAAFAGRLAGRGALDLLINNAGVMALPTRQTTADGFEMQLGTNYLGHFALTARLLPLLRAGKQARVVMLSSLAHRQGRIHLDDLQFEHGYVPWRVYAQSKLAMLMFAFELQRRSDRAGWGLLSDAAHPGWSRTELMANGPGVTSLTGRAAALFAPVLGQSAADGALPTLFAATAPAAEPGGYYGPSGSFELKGAPVSASVSRAARDAGVAARLWDASTRLTGVTWPSSEERPLAATGT